MRTRADVTRRTELDAFLRWLLGPLAQGPASSASGRTFCRASAWCWRVQPSIAATGEVHVEIRHYDPPPPPPRVDDKPDGPAASDTGLTAEEGLWHRRGWAGRS